MYQQYRSEEYVFYNPHPKGKLVGDCVKRSLTLATGKEYKEVAKELNALKKITNAAAFNESHNWQKYVELQGWEKLSFPAIKGKPRMKVVDFCNIYNEGTYVVQVAKHVVTIVDGKFYDTWDSGYKTIYTAWIVNKPASINIEDLKAKTRMVRL